MSGLYVYGITARPARVRTKGVFGRAVRTVAVGRLHAIVESATRPPRPSAKSLRAHSRVVATLVAEGMDVLPARFGSFVAGRDELSNAMQARHADLRRALNRIKGCVQMTVRVGVAEPADRRSARGARSGADYLRSLARREAAPRSHPVVRSVQRAAAPHVRASKVEWRPSPYGLRVHHLVPRGRLDIYRAAVARAVARADVQAIMTGPWAPFAFAEIA